MTDRAEEIRRMIDRGLPKASDFNSNMPGAIDYPDFFYTPEGKFIDPMGPSRIMGGTPGRAEEGFGRGKGRKGAEIATLDDSTLSIKDLIDRYGISREQAEKIVEFNTKQMIERFAGNRARSQDTSDNNLLEKILPFLGFSTRTPSSGIMEIMKNERPVSPGANEDLIFELMKEKGKETGRDRLAYGGRIGFESGTRDGRTVGMSQNRVTQLLDLREEAVNKNDQDKIIQIDQELFTMGFRVPNASGGRIGFQKGRSVQPVEIPGPAEDMSGMIKRLMDEGGMSREDAEKEAEIILFGPSAMKLRDSKNGIASMLASADDDEYKSPPFIDDPQGMFDTDEFEAIRQIHESGQLTQLSDDELRGMYDSMVESEAGIKLLEENNVNSFEEYKNFISRGKRKPEGIESIMQTMVA